MANTKNLLREAMRSLIGPGTLEDRLYEALFEVNKLRPPGDIPEHVREILTPILTAISSHPISETSGIARAIEELSKEEKVGYCKTILSAFEELC